MRALRWHGREDVRLDDVPEPRLRDGLDTLVEVVLCGICGTDVAETRAGPMMIRTTPHPLTGQAPPVTLGHELVGRVVAQRDEPFQALPAGQRVTADACLRCGRCAACQRGDYHQCRFGGSIGLHVDGGFWRKPWRTSELPTRPGAGRRRGRRGPSQTEPFAVPYTASNAPASSRATMLSSSAWPDRRGIRAHRPRAWRPASRHRNRRRQADNR